MFQFDILGNILLILAVIPAVISVAVYSRVKWYRSAAGIHLMSYMAAIASALLLGVLRILYPDSEVFYAIRAATYVAVVIVLWWRLDFLVKSYREINKESRKDEH